MQPCCRSTDTRQANPYFWTAKYYIACLRNAAQGGCLPERLISALLTMKRCGLLLAGGSSSFSHSMRAFSYCKERTLDNYISPSLENIAHEHCFWTCLRINVNFKALTCARFLQGSTHCAVRRDLQKPLCAAEQTPQTSVTSGYSFSSWQC